MFYNSLNTGKREIFAVINCQNENCFCIFPFQSDGFLSCVTITERLKIYLLLLHVKNHISVRTNFFVAYLPNKLAKMLLQVSITLTKDTFWYLYLHKWSTIYWLSINHFETNKNTKKPFYAEPKAVQHTYMIK